MGAYINVEVGFILDFKVLDQILRKYSLWVPIIKSLLSVFVKIMLSFLDISNPLEADRF